MMTASAAVMMLTMMAMMMLAAMMSAVVIGHCAYHPFSSTWMVVDNVTAPLVCARIKVAPSTLCA